jgi:hypothetical protein
MCACVCVLWVCGWVVQCPVCVGLLGRDCMNPRFKTCALLSSSKLGGCHKLNLCCRWCSLDRTIDAQYDTSTYLCLLAQALCKQRSSCGRETHVLNCPFVRHFYLRCAVQLADSSVIACTFALCAPASVVLVLVRIRLRSCVHLPKSASHLVTCSRVVVQTTISQRLYYVRERGGGEES